MPAARAKTRRRPGEGLILRGVVEELLRKVLLLGDRGGEEIAGHEHVVVRSW